jgi:hypothetical protein
MARLRHVGLIGGFAVLVVFLLEPLVFTGATPLITRLDANDRSELYKQVTTVAATFLGFLITTIAILVSLDVKRRIVEELKRGEAFSLLIVNLLAAVVLLFITMCLGIAGIVTDDGARGARLFEALWQAALLASMIEFALGLFFFALVTYKVASHK